MKHFDLTRPCTLCGEPFEPAEWQDRRGSYRCTPCRRRSASSTTPLKLSQKAQAARTVGADLAALLQRAWR